MITILIDEHLKEKWKLFFEDRYKSQLETIALSYPEEKSLYVDYYDVDRYDTNLADGLLKKPLKNQFNAEEALNEIDTTAESKMTLHFRVANLPEFATIKIRKLSPQHLNHLISIEGTIVRRTPIENKLVIGAFQCQTCGAIIKIEQKLDAAIEPSECDSQQGGCGRESNFELVRGLSTVVAWQKLQVQENPEALHGGMQPQKITVFLEDDLTNVDLINSGNRVCINGELLLIEKRREKESPRIYDFGINAWSYKVKESTYEDIKITVEDIEEIKKVSKDPLVYDHIQKSIAPSINGLAIEKDALALQAFGGIPKKLPDGTKKRGDIHILLVGDPGTAKSQLLIYMSKLVPGSLFTAGPSSTGVGLTAAAVKDEFSGGWTLEAGTLVLADGSLACVDEFDKMDERDRESMHQALEQQEISFAKAGINTTLKARCSLLAAANPKQGRFDETASLFEQIQLPSALFSRFDLIFLIIDKPKKETDEKLAKHILRSHQNPEKYENAKPFFTEDFFRKYIAYAKQNSKPVLKDDALEIIKEFFVDLRAKSIGGEVPVTPRQLETLVRLSEASARIRLDTDIGVEDAQRAIKIFYEFARQVGTDRETGQIDLDIIATGYSHSQQERMRIMVDIVNQLSKASLDAWATNEDILHEAEIAGVDISKAESALKRLLEERRIECRLGKYRMIL